MKYTVEGFQQETLIAFGLDCTDAVILRYIIDFYQTGKMKLPDGYIFTDDDKDYFWMNYGTIINELPILNIKKQALADRMNKFCECGLMLKKIIKFKNGTYTIFKIMPENYDKLVSYTPTSSELPVATSSELQTPTCSQLRTIYSSTLSNSSTKNNTPGTKKVPDQYTDLRKRIRLYFESINKSYYHNKKQIGSIENIIKRTKGDDAIIFHVFQKHLKIIRTAKENYWRNDPHTPAIIISKWDQIIAYKTDEPIAEIKYKILTEKDMK